MSDDDRYSEDLQLVERCLEGDEDSLLLIQKKFSPEVLAFVKALGASEAERHEIVMSLWTDCVVGQGTRKPRLQNYRGHCPLTWWLKKVALRELIDRRRRARREEALEAASIVPTAAGADDFSDNLVIPHRDEAPLWITDATLVEILRSALTVALSKTPNQTLVMLQLVHMNGLTQREVSRMWGWTEAKVSRSLSSGLEFISRETLNEVKRMDAWLELRWEDFIELCGTTDWSFLLN